MVRLLNATEINNYRKLFQAQKIIAIPQFLSSSTISNWLKTTDQVVQSFGVDISKIVNGENLSYRVVTGEKIRDHFRDLFEFYSSPAMLNLIKNLTQEEHIYLSNHLSSAVNINSMGHKSEQRYPWHFDAIPYTALLFLTSSQTNDGGILEVYPNVNAEDVSPIKKHIENKKLQILPEAGTLILIDGSCCYHSVTPLQQEKSRISIPMVYSQTPTHVRPYNLDNTLYNDQLNL